MTQNPDTENARLRAEVTRLRKELKREKRAHRAAVNGLWETFDRMDAMRAKHIDILSQQLETERANIHRTWQTYFFLEKQGDDPRFIRWH